VIKKFSFSPVIEKFPFPQLLKIFLFPSYRKFSCSPVIENFPVPNYGVEARKQIKESLQNKIGQSSVYFLNKSVTIYTQAKNQLNP